MNKDYEPLIIDLKKSDPIRSTRGSLTLFLLALLMSIVSVTTFLLSSLYSKTSINTPFLEMVDLKTESTPAKTSTTPKSVSTPKPVSTAVKVSKEEPTSQTIQSPKSPVSSQKDSKLRTPNPEPSPKLSKEMSTGPGKNVKVPQVSKKDKGTDLKDPSVDKPPSVEETKIVEPKDTVVKPPERVQTERNRTSEPVGFGFITVRTVPENVAVYLNEKFIGTTPLIEFQVPAGRLPLKLVHQEAPPVYQSITVAPLQTVSVFQEFEKADPLDTMEGFQKYERIGSLIIKASSSGAEVYLTRASQEYRGYTPFVRDLPAGIYQLTVEKDGFKTVTRTIEVVEGKETEVFVTLKRLGVVYPDRRHLPNSVFPDYRSPRERRLERFYR